MEIIKHIFLLIAVLGFFACSDDSQKIDHPDDTDIRGLINVEVMERQGEASDRMESVRFIIFTNSTGIPKLELNERFDIPDSPSENNQISKFKITLEVNMLSGKENNKIVVGIINEPSTLFTALENVHDYNQLLDMQLNFDDFLNTGHNGLQNNKTMPMAGVVWTNKVYPNETQAANNPVSMSVHRAPARVDIYLRKEEGMDFSLGTGTEFILQNTYNKEYLIRYENEGDIFGNVQTVTSGFLTKNRTLLPGDEKDIPVVSNTDKGRLIVSFYTPERTCTAANDADKLILTINILTNEGTPRSAEIIIDRFFTGGVEKQINILSRNNIYTVIATVGTTGITAAVYDWNDEDIHTEL